MAMSNMHYDQYVGPVCPECMDYDCVYCMSEEVYAINCSCTTDEFYCSKCDHDFNWTLSDFERLMDDMDEILDIQIVEDMEYLPTVDDIRTDHGYDWKGGCGNCGDLQPHHCTLGSVVIEWDGNNYASVSKAKRLCPNCGDHKEHECKTPDGLIIAWNGESTVSMVDESTGEVSYTCHCTPQKLYICATCGVERDTMQSEWEKRPIAQTVRTAATVAEAILKVNDIIMNNKPFCRCADQPAYFCGACRVTRTTPTSDWTELDGYQAALDAWRKQNNGNTVVSKATKGTPVPYGNTKQQRSPGKASSNTAWDNDDYYWYGMGGKCRHYGQEVILPVSKTVIRCSSIWDERKDPKDYPDRGLYFDWMWKPDWRSELSLWPDYNIPTNMKATAQAIKEHYEWAKKGQHIEIGCIGGHGRTGTALACMLVLDGIPASQAGTWVKANYCHEAIESPSQFWYIKWFEAWHKGEPLPEKPVTASMKTQSGVPTYCTRGQHYLQWMANPKATTCTHRKAACTMFDKDIKEFETGKVDAFVIKSALEISGDTKFNNIDGYMVPKTKAGERSHNRNERNCQCDYCRYRNSYNLGAFLDPWPVTSIWIQTPTGPLETSVTPEFTPKPPVEDGQREGERIGDYIWTTHQGKQVWVWDAIKRAKARYIKENTERNKSKTAPTAQKEGTAPPGVTITGSGQMTLDEAREAVADSGWGTDSKRNNRRNKKNPKRDGTRRRASKRRR